MKPCKMQDKITILKDEKCSNNECLMQNMQNEMHMHERENNMRSVNTKNVDIDIQERLGGVDMLELKNNITSFLMKMI